MLYRNRPGTHVKSLAPNQLSATMNMPTNLSSGQVANKKTSPYPPPPSPTNPNTGFVSLRGLSGWPWQICCHCLVNFGVCNVRLDSVHLIL